MASLQKSTCKGFNIFNVVIFFISPKEGLFESLFFVVGVILGIDAVGDNKDLDVVKQRRVKAITVLLLTVDLIEGFFEL